MSGRRGAEKLQRDGRRTSSDEDRIQAIYEERERLRKSIEEQAAARAVEELKEREAEVAAHNLDDDEVSFNTGILSTKACDCGSVMTIRQGPLASATQVRKFFWQCTNITRRIPCKRVYFDPHKDKAAVIRPSDAELDMPKAKRREAWSRPDVIQTAHSRLRQHLDDEDLKVVCPHHVLPMRLMQRRDSGGKLLDSYEYVCLGVHANGQACKYVEPVVTMPQVSSILQRTEGMGLL